MALKETQDKLAKRDARVSTAERLIADRDTRAAKDRSISLKLTEHLRRQLEEVSKKTKTAEVAREVAEEKLEAVMATRESELEAAITTAEATRVAELEAAFKAAEMPAILEGNGRSESPSGVEEAEAEATKEATPAAPPPTLGTMTTCSAAGGLGVSCSDKLNELRGKLRKETARAVSSALRQARATKRNGRGTQPHPSTSRSRSHPLTLTLSPLTLSPNLHGLAGPP